MKYTARNIRDFWKWIEKTDTCWLYRGYSIVNGYGRKWIDGRDMMVHHIAWELTYGDVPKGMFVRHFCDNALCVNPEHLFLAASARGKGAPKRLELSGDDSLVKASCGLLCGK